MNKRKVGCMEEEKYFTIEESRHAKDYDDIKNQLGVVIYPSDAVREEEAENETTFCKEELPGGLTMVVEVLMQEPDGFYHVPVETFVAVRESLDISDMFDDALECMERHFPAIFEKATDRVNVSMLFEDPNFYLIHTDEVFGASALFYEGMMEQIAESFGCSYFIMPLTKDFFLLAADDGTKDADRLQDLLIDQNERIYPDDQLTSTLLYYDRATHRLTAASDAKNSNVVYLNRTVTDYLN